MHTQPEPVALRLRTYSRREAAGHPLLGPLSEWVASYIARPHSELGRHGAICPFVPRSLRQDLVRYALVEPAAEDERQLADAAVALQREWLDMAPRTGPHAVDKTIVLALPHVPSATLAAVHDRLKPRYVAADMMLGEFYPGHAGPGLHNPDFRPLDCEIPLLVVRRMLPTDLPLLLKDRYPAARRVEFVNAFLHHHAEASPSTLEQAEALRARSWSQLTGHTEDLAHPA